MVVALALTPAAYLLGTFPAAHLVARAYGRDITREGSGNPGASNVYRVLGWRAAAVVFAVDIAKGALPALAGLVLWDHAGAYVLGGAAVLGHMFPITRRFRGGRGVATAGGLAFVVYPLVAAILLVGFLLVARLSRRASLASVAVTVALPLLVWSTGEAMWEVAVLSGLGLLVIIRHAANLGRLVRGQELRLDDERPDRGSRGVRPDRRSRDRTRWDRGAA